MIEVNYLHRNKRDKKNIEFNKEKDNRTFAFMNKLVDIKLLNLDVLGVKSSKYALE